MKKILIMLLSTALLLVACNNSSNEEPNKEPAEETNKNEVEIDNNNNQIDEEKIQYVDFQSAIPAEWQVQLPTNYPIAEDKFLTAKTTTTENEITFEFYEFDKEVALDAPNITDGYYIGQLTVTRYEDELKADDDVKIQLTLHDDYVADAGPELIYPFIAGDESVVNWTNNSGWYVFAYSREKSEQELVEWIKEKDLVSEITNGTESGYYPRPQIVGQMHFYADDKTKTFVTWAEKEIVFTLKDFSENTLDWLHVFSR
ncbi:hypothetical protein FJQ98_15595 [Lysinibacillus agricola]|uniref:Lipoprotein n=1 Tax=Lysinibacillus agricola TaxID=2590012 RepID=A0ABX7ALI7_9BACI|nr:MULTISPECIES: hypothetical protein [Lysinibacillus]KOS59895.1 hypothetical protein AN161_26650 [Lysinibacillus sp. FJAT-14222]QQP10674.1 hypothetical protein FJQ98_15595 [Lysinibacillus agricola]